MEFRQAVAETGPFGRRCLSILPCSPFPLPAHQTGRADFPHPAFGQGNSCCRPREIARPALKLEQTQLFVQVGRRIANGVNTPTPVFAVQPLA